MAGPVVGNSMDDENEYGRHEIDGHFDDVNPYDYQEEREYDCE